MPLTEKLFDSADALNQDFASAICAALTQDIEQRGNASLVVSGGRTPVALFKQLSTQDISWDKVTITLADERWVNEDDDASNTKLVKTHLLQNHAAVAQFISLKTEHDDAYEAQAAVAERLSGVPQPFTVTILGMGEDGHTASLFPCSEEVTRGLDKNNNDICLAVTPTTAPHQRMSLTLNAIADSTHCFLHLTGESKKQVLHDALNDVDAPKPIISVIQSTDVTLYWAP